MAAPTGRSSRLHQRHRSRTKLYNCQVHHDDQTIKPLSKHETTNNEAIFSDTSSQQRDHRGRQSASEKNVYLFNNTSSTRNSPSAISAYLVKLSALLMVCLTIAQFQAQVQCRTTPDNGRSARHKSQMSRRSALVVDGPTTATSNLTSPNESPLVRSARLLDIDAIGYLERFGYMNGTAGNANLIQEDTFREAVMSFQRFANLPETGTIDSTTVKFMQMPRCGNKDKAGKGENAKRKRRKRYALQGSKWVRKELTYRISQYPTRFANKKHEIDYQIKKALETWSAFVPIDFTVKKEGKAHIEIRFAGGEHGDGDPFDGPGNTLAHAFFPQYGGDVHFDDQEYWTIDSYAGTNIFQVAAHEIGHSLGLGHSSIRDALMAPFYQKYNPNFKLHADDILAIQALYGEKGDEDTYGSSPSSTTTSSTTPRTTTDTPSRRRGTSEPSDRGRAADLCVDSKIDAITRTEDGNTYVFKGSYYWLVKNEGLASGYPAKISRDWDGLPSNLDAALTWSDGKTFFFKGDKYWRFTNKRREPGYPKLISAGFAGIPNNIDTAFVWGGNGKTYFFKGDKYWRFESKQEPPVSNLYPKSIKNWVGLPTPIDAAFKWENGMTYFFKDDQYYRFDDREFEVDTTSKPSFPRSTGEWWFGCINNNLPIKDPKDDEDDLAQGGSNSQTSVLSFHRKPNLLFESSAPEDKVDASSSSPSTTTSTTANPPPPLTGNSISRSILSSLSSLFSLSSLSDDNSSSKPAPLTDWSIHKGFGEETRSWSNKKPQVRVHPISIDLGDRSSRRLATRVQFPTPSSSPRCSLCLDSGEQSMSE